MATAALQSAPSWWRRPLWMRLAAFSGCASVLIWLYANMAVRDSGVELALKLGAQMQFMHGMATFACATFMNIGARGARHAPAFFLGGALLFCGPVYAVALGAPPGLSWIEAPGLAALVTGWLILAWSAGDIDR
jgi:uncharacterized membrane protein YgdD (TMEM256/DUF423 family)